MPTSQTLPVPTSSTKIRASDDARIFKEIKSRSAQRTHQFYSERNKSGVKTMPVYPSDIAFTPAVKSIQETKGSRTSYSRLEEGRGWKSTVTPELEEFLAERDMFYFGTSNSEGQPYIQYRGGSEGFLKVIDEKTLGFADFAGNRQYITLGNLSESSKAFIFLMDYAHSRRIKLWGNARVVENDPALNEKLGDPSYPGKIERVILFEINAWDINCPQHIHKRFSQKQVAPVIEQLQERIADLEEKLASFDSEGRN